MTAHVEMRVIQDGLRLPGTVTAPATLELKLAGEGVLGTIAPASEEVPITGDDPRTAAEESEVAASSGSDRNVISRMVAVEGNSLAAGDLLAEVSGRPVIAAPPGTPLYRDLVLGIAGEDVRAVQQMLSGLGYLVDLDGILDADTMDTITYWYAQLGYELAEGPGGRRGLSWKELLPLPPGAVTVTATSARGTVLREGTPVLTVQRGNPVVETMVNAAQVAQLREADTVYVVFAGASVEAEVLSVGDLRTDDDTGISGHTVRVACPPELAEKSGDATTVSIMTAMPEEATLAVPVTAIEEDGRSQFVLLEPDESEDAETHDRPAERVNIDVIAVSGGWAAIADNAQLSKGTEIRVR